MRILSIFIISVLLSGCGISEQKVIENEEFNLQNYPERLIVLELKEMNNILNQISETLKEKGE